MKESLTTPPVTQNLQFVDVHSSCGKHAELVTETQPWFVGSPLFLKYK